MGNARDEVTILRKDSRLDLARLADLFVEPLEKAGVIRAIVFGSYARGRADGYSDVDLAVVMPTDRPPLERGGRLPEIFEAVPVGIDLLIYTPQEFARGMRQRTGVFDSIAREGMTVYERSGG